jgi:serine/threonine-protein kinase
LEDLGFVVETGDPVDLEFGDELDGMVAEQDPAGGVTLDYGSTVTLRIGVAADVVPVPNVIGFDPDTAQEEIESAGLAYARGEDVILDPDTQAGQVGTVVAVTPDVGTELDPGTVVTVQVGAAGAKVPDVTSTCLTPDEAEAAIVAAGLGYEEVGVDDTLPVGHECDGRIIEQIPGPYTITGRLVAAGTTVQVRIGQAMVSVPDLYGLGPPSARQEIRDAGLDPVDAGCVVDPNAVNRIASQTPAAGTAVPRGSSVEISLGIAAEGDTCTFGT